jgi:hypothetical protein
LRIVASSGADPTIRKDHRVRRVESPEQRTRRTLSASALRCQLAEVRETGVARERDGAVLGGSSVAIKERGSASITPPIDRRTSSFPWSTDMRLLGAARGRPKQLR